MRDLRRWAMKEGAALDPMVVLPQGRGCEHLWLLNDSKLCVPQMRHAVTGYAGSSMTVQWRIQKFAMEGSTCVVSRLDFEHSLIFIVRHS